MIMVILGIIVLILRSVLATLSEENSLLMESSHGKCLSDPSGVDKLLKHFLMNYF